MPNTWIIEQTDDTVLVTRRKPVRWDVSATATFPKCRALRLAHQIRQDMWRELQKIKGFCPAVEVTLGETYTVRAGGRAQCHVHPNANQWVEGLLNSDIHRRRWIANARDKRTPAPGLTRGLHPSANQEAPGQARGGMRSDA